MINLQVADFAAIRTAAVCCIGRIETAHPSVIERRRSSRRTHCIGWRSVHTRNDALGVADGVVRMGTAHVGCNAGCTAVSGTGAVGTDAWHRTHNWRSGIRGTWLVIEVTSAHRMHRRSAEIR